MLGAIKVDYTFQGSSGSVNMANGEYSKEFEVTVDDGNSNPQKDRTLFLNLTSVTGSMYLFVIFMNYLRLCSEQLLPEKFSRLNKLSSVLRVVCV